MSKETMNFFESIYYINQSSNDSSTAVNSYEQQLHYDCHNARGCRMDLAENLFDDRFREITYIHAVGYNLDFDTLSNIGMHVIDLDNLVLLNNSARITYGNVMSASDAYDDDEPEFARLTKEMVFFLEEIETFIITSENEHGKHVYRIYIQYRDSVDVILRYLLGNKILLKPITTTPAPKIGLLIQRDSGLDISTTALNVPDVGELDVTYGSGFKDISDRVLNIVKDKNQTGLLIFHGVAGTGKTTYIKWLSGQTHRRFVYIPSYMVTSITQPAFMDLFLNLKNIVFVIEDAEESLGHRYAGGNNVVSTLLNLTDGILADTLNCQFIVTFNTELEHIDSALLRPGRLLVRHEFDKLSVEESNRFLVENKIDCNVNEPKTLAELTHLKNKTVGKLKPQEKETFGFNNK